MVAVKFLVSLLILIILVIFALMNMEPEVTIKFYDDFMIGPIPLSFAVLGAAAAGSLLTAIITLFEQMRLRYIIRKSRGTIQDLESELLEYRKTPPEPIHEEDDTEIEEESIDDGTLKLPPRNTEENREQ